jgi:hypothetical protein
MSSIPLVIIIDLDGTIIGDITQQIMSYELCKGLKKSGTKITYDVNDFRMKLKTGIVRPHFDSFMKSLSNTMNLEFFIYTASEKTWADFVIKNIEATYNIKFNRPIFSREYCIYSEKDREYKKSLSLIRPALLKALKKKYSVSFTKQDISSNVMIIDNNNVYNSEDHKHLLLCPTYNYRVPENVPCIIKHDLYKSQYLVINSILKKYMSLSSSMDYDTFQKEFYLYYISYMDTQMRNNLRYAQDKFWLYVKDIITSQHIRTFDESSVRYITNTVRGRIGLSPIQVKPALSRGVLHQVLPKRSVNAGTIYSKQQLQKNSREAHRHTFF